MAAAATRADRWGHPVRTTSDACVSAIDAYYHQILSYGRDRKVILEAARRDPDCVLANALAAHFVFSKKPPAATSYLAAAASRLEDATSYEKAVYRAVSCLLSEDRDDDVVINVHRELLKEFPKDLISLKRAQVLCFYIGRPDLSINLVEQVLSHNQQEAYIYGMLAFPLLELGRMCDAEKYALKGFEINKDDFWSQHALCHVLQNDCRFKEAVEFMEACSSSWATCLSFMYTHNWWHVAVCYLEGHSPLEKVLEIYDCYIWKELERDDADCEEVYLNALGLLLRFAVRGQMDYTGDRLKTVVAVFRNELAEALLEYGKASHHKVFDILGPNFDAIDYKMIGASDEQLDVFNEVWYIVLLNTGHTYEAIEAIEKRVKQREGVPFLWHLLERAYSMEGRPDASFASTKAKALEVAYFK
uniref:Tetratricopeptide repeat protein 38 n=1 Tax=Anthurium amnicola TaxID=1678845 RepID=A0A1D1Z362_9ARAE